MPRIQWDSNPTLPLRLLSYGTPLPLLLIFHEKIFHSIIHVVIEMQNTTMEHSSVSNLGGVMDLFSACHLMMFPFVPSVTKIFQMVSALWSRHDFHAKIYNGA